MSALVNARLKPFSKKKYQKAFYWALLLATLTVWSPFNLLGYLIPFVVIIVLLLSGDTVIVVRSVIWIACWAIFISVHALLKKEFFISNSIIAFLTFSSFWIAFTIPSKYLTNFILKEKLARFLANVLVVESVWGCVQGFYGFLQTKSFDIANGDFVEGTIHPALASEKSFSNVMFASNVAFMLIFLLPYVARRKYLFPFFLGLFALVLASVVHVLLFLFLALGISIFLYKPILIKRRAYVQLLILLIIFPFIAYSVLSQNFETLPKFVKQLYTGDTPRSQIIYASILHMPMEYRGLQWIGLGPGQFTSRAGLISTGMYFGSPLNPKPLPLLPTNITTPQEKFLIELWIEGVTNPYYGSTHQPYFSWLTVYTEFGIPIFMGGLGVTIYLTFWIKKRVNASEGKRFVATAAGTGTLLLFLLGFQENYWEIPQAIILGILCLKVLYADLCTQANA